MKHCSRVGNSIFPRLASVSLFLTCLSLSGAAAAEKHAAWSKGRSRTGRVQAGIDVHCLRDLTRGGLATTLVEIAEAAGLNLHIEERSIPVLEEVRGACEVLGLDPLYVANEGRFVAFVPGPQAEQALAVLQGTTAGAGARRIGIVQENAGGLVTMTGVLGARRILDMLSGEQLPRIC